MRIDIVAFDGFTDIDVVFPWDLLHRVPEGSWDVRIVGTSTRHRSTTGLELPMHGTVDDLASADVVLFASGMGTRALIADPAYLRRLRLDPSRQMIGSMCSGALILAALGLLDGKEATTYPTAAAALESYGIRVVERPFVSDGNIATAAGCLAAQHLAGWVVERHLGPAERDRMLRSIQPVGEGLSRADATEVAAVYGAQSI
ncbi:MAG: DJ-1/PfpI family protein [Ilumatobacteraceae bacterium]